MPPFDIPDTAFPIIYGTFARTIMVIPTVSMPGMPQYTSRGIYDDADVEITGTDGSSLVDKITTVDIWEKEFPKIPEQGDTVIVPPEIGQEDSGVFSVQSVQDCGMVESRLFLRRITPNTYGDMTLESMQMKTTQDATVT
jgi:hypothetical protein